MLSRVAADTEKNFGLVRPYFYIALCGMACRGWTSSNNDCGMIAHVGAECPFWNSCLSQKPNVTSPRQEKNEPKRSCTRKIHK